MIKQIIYTSTEQFLLDKFSYMNEIKDYELERLAKDLELFGSLYISIELGRCPSTDVRTYILHYQDTKPQFDYYGYEYITLPGKTNSNIKAKLKNLKELTKKIWIN